MKIILNNGKEYMPNNNESKLINDIIQNNNLKKEFLKIVENIDINNVYIDFKKYPNTITYFICDDFQTHSFMKYNMLSNAVVLPYKSCISILKEKTDMSEENILFNLKDIITEHFQLPYNVNTVTYDTNYGLPIN